MRAEQKKTAKIFLCVLALSLLCIGCGKKEKEIYASEALEAIGYDYEKTIASPQHEVLFQNADKTTIYHVTYHPDTTAKEAAEAFEAGESALTKEKTTWEKNMWEYSCFGYENHYSGFDAEVFFSSVDWDLELWKYVIEDAQKKSVTETLFFDRADGCYSIEMTYPAEDIATKATMYWLAVEQDFKVDRDRIKTMEEGLEWKDEINEKGELVITVTNHGEETVQRVSYIINADIEPVTMEDGTVMSGKGFSQNKDDLQPGETHTFIESAEDMKDVIDYRLDTYLHYASRIWDENGKVWIAH